MTNKPSPTIILASASKIRRKILLDAGLDFSIYPTLVDEDQIKRSFLKTSSDLPELAKTLALAKANCVKPSSNQVVIGADQIMEMDAKLFDKPKTMAEAKERLLAMAGREHRLIGAVVIVRPGSKLWSHISITRLKMRNFSPAFLDNYLHDEGEDILQTVGAYKFEGRGATLFEWVRGDFFSILGLPLLPLLAQLREMEILTS